MKDRTFGGGASKRPRINLIRIEEDLSEVHLRLARATIENLSWDQFIPRYDRPETFFYLDPPYYKAPYYKHNMVIDDYRKLSEILKGIKGKFILSINDHKEMREVFDSFIVRPVSLTYTCSAAKRVEGKELLIRNF